MAKRYASIWFPYLITDRHAVKSPRLRNVPFAVAIPVQGRMVVMEANAEAEANGIERGMVVADARACLPELEVSEVTKGLAERLLKVLGYWCIRYTPVVSVDPPDGLILDISGCAHLWKGEQPYRKEIEKKLWERGFQIRIGIAGTVGAAWALARFGQCSIVENGKEAEVLQLLPPAALRLAPDITDRMHRLGLRTIGHFLHMPGKVLRKRFGGQTLLRLCQSLGTEDEPIVPLRPIPPYVERLPCPEPIRTAEGIEQAIVILLERLCKRLTEEGKGLRKAVLWCYRVDRKRLQIGITTSSATASVPHLLRLFTLNIPQIEPALGIEIFVLEAINVEKAVPARGVLWNGGQGLAAPALAELIDRLNGRQGIRRICRYLPEADYWPERSYRVAASLIEKPQLAWRNDQPRPIRLLPTPELVEVTAPIPDYPPMIFRFRGETHVVCKADGPERIVRSWWMDEGEHRDYYQVEDVQGRRYWIFRSGFYGEGRPQRWFLHGFFA